MNVWLHYASYSCQCLTIFSTLLNPVKFTFSLLLNRLFCAVCFFCTIMSRLVCVTPVLSLTADWNEAMPRWNKARPEKCLNKCQSLSERIPQTERARKFPAKWLFIEMHQVPQTRNTNRKHADYREGPWGVWLVSSQVKQPSGTQGLSWKHLCCWEPSNHSMIHRPGADPICRLQQLRGSMNFSRRFFCLSFP